ncbi:MULTISPECIES: hypothetical protein [Arthrobacter]|uniref:hypothetical protein n=1 Tax=Arthrobacter TaxID=1663 RepID=UPI0011CDEE78|nr:MULTISPECIES: hypothetical protein [Arthrobacter]QYF88584.1 hypothetical protein KY499_09920 [Arthrobacter sp. PAMC25284]
MSLQPSSLPVQNETDRLLDTLTGEPDEGGAPGIRQQTLMIIGIVLAGDDPEQAPARDLLRARLEANPGRPELALAEHLGALGSKMFPAGPDTGVDLPGQLVGAS